MIISKKIKEWEIEVVGVSDACRLTNEVMNAYMDSKMVEDVANEKDEAITRNQNWVLGERIVGVKKKRVDFFIRVKTRVKCYEMKSKLWDNWVEEGLHATIKNAKLKYMKRVGMTLGVCALHASKEWH